MASIRTVRDPKLMQRYLSSAGDPNATCLNDVGVAKTLLQLAVTDGHFDTAAMLLEAGADPRRRMGGYSPLVLAFMRSTPALARLLMQRLDVASDVGEPIWLVAVREHTTRLRLNFYRNLRKLGVDINGCTHPLPASATNDLVPAIVHAATALHGDRLAMVQGLINQGAHCRGAAGGRPWLAHCVDEWLAPGDGDIDGTEDPDAGTLAQMLIGVGADPNAHCADVGMSAFHDAVAGQAPMLVTAMIAAGADVNDRRTPVRHEHPDYSPIWLAGPGSAAGQDDVQYATLDILIRNGARVWDTVELHGERVNVFEAAANYRLPRFLHVLIRNGYWPEDALVIAVMHNLPTVVEALVLRGANAMARATNGDSIFHLATAATECMHILLAHSHTAALVTMQGGEYSGHETVVHALVGYGWALAQRHALMAVLATPESRAMLNATRSDTGTTALADACFHRNAEAVKILLEAGADPNAGDADSQPLMYAARFDDDAGGTTDTVFDLLDHGAEPRTDVLNEMLRKHNETEEVMKRKLPGRLNKARLLMCAGAELPATGIFRRQGFSDSAALTGVGPVFNTHEFSPGVLAGVIAMFSRWTPMRHKHHFGGRWRAGFRDAVKTLMLVQQRRRAGGEHLPELPAELYFLVIDFLA